MTAAIQSVNMIQVLQTKEALMLKGIQFVVDKKGKKQAVLIDLNECGDLWEDIYDVLVSQSRKNEPRVSWEELKAELGKEDLKVG